MTLRNTTLILLVLTMIHNKPADAGQLLYLASTQEKTITAYHVNEDTGDLKRSFTVTLPGNAGAMAFSSDHSRVYAAVTGLQDKRAGVATLSRAKDGTLKLLNTATITSRAPYIRADKNNQNLLAAHYGAGEVTVYRIRDGICTGELTTQIKTEKTAHCIEIDPSGRFVYVPHTGPNKLYQFRLNADSGVLTALDPPFVAGPDTEHRYHEPRHYAHHPTLKMAYTSNENGGGITAWHFNEQTGAMRRGKTLCTLPDGYKESSHAADIQITPDGRFAYVSNRDTTKRSEGQLYQDNICAVAIDGQTGAMRIVGQYPTGRYPRATCIDLKGGYFFAAGQLSNDLYAYRLDAKTGALKHLKTYPTGGTPIWVMCGSVE